jgi:hypothetical protein
MGGQVPYYCTSVQYQSSRLLETLYSIPFAKQAANRFLVRQHPGPLQARSLPIGPALRLLQYTLSGSVGRNANIRVWRTALSRDFGCNGFRISRVVLDEDLILAIKDITSIPQVRISNITRRPSFTEY